MTTKQIEALQLALENICAAKLCEFNSMSSRHEMIRLMAAAITAIREAMAHAQEVREQPAQTATYTCGVCGVSMQMEQPAQQEPVAWILKPTMDLLWPHEVDVKDPSKSKGYKPLYTSPQSKPWAGLTDEEIYRIDCLLITDIKQLSRAIEAKLKEKNA